MPRAVAASGVLALVAGGCVKHDLTVRPIDIERQRAALRAGTPATVIGGLGDEVIRLSPTQQIQIVDRQSRRFPIQLAEVMRDCDGPELAAEEPGRLCALHGIDYVIVGQRRRGPGALLWQVPLALAVAGTLGAVGYCTTECERPYNIISIAGLTMLGGVLVYALLSYDGPKK